jgi:thiamine biosynthesis lipoprotein
MLLVVALFASLAAAPAPAGTSAGPRLDIDGALLGEMPSDDVIRRGHPAMGTIVEVSVFGGGKQHALDAIDAVFAEVDRIEALCSEWRPKTPLGQVNAAAGDHPVVVDAELFELVQRALAFAEQTRGAFDPTFASLWGLWTFGDDGVHKKPRDEDVEARRALIGARRVVVDTAERSIFLPVRGMKLGLGGIAKGYAVDRAVALLRARGVTTFVVRAGGDSFLHNARFDARLGIRDPRGADMFATLPARAVAAVSTSGDYERFFIDDGVRYHHIIDPRTARPARGVRSATVLAPDATTADALTKAVFILGPREGIALIESLPGIAAIVVDDDSRVTVSSRVPRGLSLRAPTARSP